MATKVVGKELAQKVQETITMLTDIQPSKMLSLHELQDKVRQIVAWKITEQIGTKVRIISPPVGGPLGSETEQQYRERLFRWLVKITIAASTKQPKMALSLATWLIKHSTGSSQPDNESLILKF